MRKIISLFLLCLVFLQINAQTSTIVCSAGFTFEISDNPNWGKGEPVVVDITPGSPAERAGLKLNDIILEINRKGTYLKPYSTIKSWLLDNNDRLIEMSIRNLETSFRTIKIEKSCNSSNGIDEAQLASVFAFYSLEDVQNRVFHIPMNVTTNSSAVFSDYQTFDFEQVSGDVPEIDLQISAIFERALKQRGLTRDTNDPDLIVQTFYSYQNNPSYQPAVINDKKNDATTWRFSTERGQMVKVPVYSPTEVVNNREVPYILEFGYRFYDRKHLEPGSMTLIWEAEVKELVKSTYNLTRYLEVNLPLILLRYPYSSGNGNMATYQVDQLKYNYTGISYDIDDISIVAYVVPNSPADRAGIKAGDRIKRVQGVKLENDLKALTNSYRDFIGATMSLRNPSTRYTDSSGYANCMFWDVSEYQQVSKTMRKKRYATAFTYLFNFNQYVDWETPSSLSFEIERGGKKVMFEVVPEVYKSFHISTH